MEAGGEDCVVVGTPLVSDYATNRYRREPVKDPALARQLPLWKQEVTDEEGRRRFHGAFTGGFSAGYYNTVGSKEGWAPSSFTSSRGNRASGSSRAQAVEDFLDEDEKEERQRQRLESTLDYDTFGDAASEKARRIAEFESRKDGQGIPGGPLFIPDWVAPENHSVGIRMLISLGWRRGRRIGKRRDEDESATDQSAKLQEGLRLIGASKPSKHITNPKLDTFGLGFDPYVNAVEFLNAKRSKKADAAKHRSKQSNQAFGFGVFDEDDQMPLGDEYGNLKQSDYDFEIKSEDDEDDRAGQSRHSQKISSLRGAETPKLLKGVRDVDDDSDGGGEDAMEGFLYGGRLDHEHGGHRTFAPPKVPASYREVHLGPVSPDADGVEQAGDRPSKVDPPKDEQVARTITVLARFVAKNGPGFEALAKAKNRFETKFNFLHGGTGAGYYRWKLFEEKERIKASQLERKSRQKRGDPSAPALKQPLDAFSRAALLTGKSLDEVRKTGAAVSKPLIAEPKQKEAKSIPQSEKKVRAIGQEDKARLSSNLNAMFTSGNVQDLGHVERAGLYYPGQGKSYATSSANPRGESDGKDCSVGKERRRPVRTHQLWQPTYLLCKRFGVKDPHDGKAIDASASIIKFRSDAIALTQSVGDAEASGAAAATKCTPEQRSAAGDGTASQKVPSVDKAVLPGPGDPIDSKSLADQFLGSLGEEGIAKAESGGGSDGEGPGKTDEETGNDGEAYVEKPLDLFKAIFEDSSDDEEDDTDGDDDENGGDASIPAKPAGGKSDPDFGDALGHKDGDKGVVGGGSGPGRDVLQRFQKSPGDASGKGKRKRHRHLRRRDKGKDEDEDEGEGIAPDRPRKTKHKHKHKHRHRTQ